MELINISLWRHQKGLTQAQLASLSGIPRPNLCNIERGLSDPTLSTLSKIARALNISTSLLLSSPPTKLPTLNRHDIDQVSRALVSGKRSMKPELNALADQCASLITQKLQAHKAPGFSRVARLKLDKGFKKSFLFKKYDSKLINQILVRANKFL